MDVAVTVAAAARKRASPEWAETHLWGSVARRSLPRDSTRPDRGHGARGRGPPNHRSVESHRQHGPSRFRLSDVRAMKYLFAGETRLILRSISSRMARRGSSRRNSDLQNVLPRRPRHAGALTPRSEVGQLSVARCGGVARRLRACRGVGSLPNAAVVTILRERLSGARRQARSPVRRRAEDVTRATECREGRRGSAIV